MAASYPRHSSRGPIEAGRQPRRALSPAGYPRHSSRGPIEAPAPPRSARPCWSACGHDPHRGGIGVQIRPARNEGERLKIKGVRGAPDFADPGRVSLGRRRWVTPPRRVTTIRSYPDHQQLLTGRPGPACSVKSVLPLAGGQGLRAVTYYHQGQVRSAGSAGTSPHPKAAGLDLSLVQSRLRGGSLTGAILAF